MLKEFAQEVYNLISKGFCQKYNATTIDGEQVSQDSEEASNFCLYGATKRVRNNNLHYTLIAYDFFQQIEEAVSEGNIIKFNDTHSKEEVLKMLNDTFILGN